MLVYKLEKSFKDFFFKCLIKKRPIHCITKFVAHIIFTKDSIIFHNKIQKTHPLAEKNKIVNIGMDFHLWE